MSDALGRGIAKAGFALILAAVMWTIVASMVFLIGTGLYHYFVSANFGTHSKLD